MAIDVVTNNGVVSLVVPVETLQMENGRLVARITPTTLAELDGMLLPPEAPAPVPPPGMGRQEAIADLIERVQEFNAMLATKRSAGIVPDLEVIELPGAPAQLILKRVNIKD